MTPDAGGKSYLIQTLMLLGYSRSKSIEAVNAVFDAWRSALQRGEQIELPVGIARIWVQPKTVSKFRKKADFVKGDPTKRRPVYKLLRMPRNKKYIRFIPDRNIDI